MVDLKEQYLKIFVYFCACVFIAVALGAIVWLLVPRRYRSEKNSPYECGFETFGGAKFKFNVQFYIVAILFVIFDVEIIFLYPWAQCLRNTGFFGLFFMFIFMVLLGIGFIYEWNKGALNWKPVYGKRI